MTTSSSYTTIPCKTGTILLLTLLSFQFAHAWIVTKPTTTTHAIASGWVFSTRTRIPSAVYHMSSTPPEDEEEECPSEEECEIDWDQMPGFDEDEDDNDEQTTQESSFLNGPIIYNDFEEDLEQGDDFSSVFTSFTPVTVQRAVVESAKEKTAEPVSMSAAASQQARAIGNYKRGMVNLEMNWQMTAAAQECNVDIPTTCGSSECQTCQGSGKRTCRFCRGTHFMKFDGLKDFMACRICKPDGTEVCTSCRGSGWIADWTNMGPHTGATPQEIDDDDDDADRLLP